MSEDANPAGPPADGGVGPGEPKRLGVLVWFAEASAMSSREEEGMGDQQTKRPCPKCGQEIFKQEISCPWCGAPLTAAQPPESVRQTTSISEEDRQTERQMRLIGALLLLAIVTLVTVGAVRSARRSALLAKVEALEVALERACELDHVTVTGATDDGSKIHFRCRTQAPDGKGMWYGTNGTADLAKGRAYVGLGLRECPAVMQLRCGLGRDVQDAAKVWKDAGSPIKPGIGGLAAGKKVEGTKRD